MTIAYLADLPDLSTKPQVGQYLQVSVATLDRWHAEGRGPRRITLGGGAVRYRKDDVLKFLNDTEAA